MPHWSETEEGKVLAQALFNGAELPDISDEQVDMGALTNLDIARLFPTLESLSITLNRITNNPPRVKRRLLQDLGKGMPFHDFDEL